MSHWLFNVYMDAVMKEVKMGMGRKGENGDYPRMMAGRFAEMYRRRGLKVNAGKSKVMVMNGEEGLVCVVHVDGVRLEHVSEFKYLACVLDEAGTDGTECSRKEANGWRVTGAIRSLVNW